MSDGARKQLLREMAEKKRKVAVFGAGNYGWRVCRALRKELGGENIIGFIDSKSPMKMLMDLPVYRPDETEVRALNPVVVLASRITDYLEEMEACCRTFGYESIRYDRLVPASAAIPSPFALKTPSALDPGAMVSLDLTDACNINCLNCLRSRKEPLNRGDRLMTLDTFRKVVEKGLAAGYSRIGLYNWTEPFLHPEVALFAKHAREQGMEVWISSNLSLPSISALVPTLEQCHVFLGSVSGFTREMHARNHRGSDIEVVKRHLETVAATVRSNKCDCFAYARYLDFGYNAGEIDAFREYIESLGLGFARIEGLVVHDPESITNASYVSRISECGDEFGVLRRAKQFKSCALVRENIPVDYRGDVYLCCAEVNFPYLRIGSLIEDDFETLQALRYVHPHCCLCERKKAPMLETEKKFLLDAK